MSDHDDNHSDNSFQSIDNDEQPRHTEQELIPDTTEQHEPEEHNEAPEPRNDIAQVPDPGNNTPDEDEEEEQGNMPNEALPGSQLSIAREFAGKPGDDVEIWTAHIERCQKTFTWTNEQTAQIALNKITDTAAKWAEAQISLGVEFKVWNELKQAITTRFKAEISDATAAMAMSELQQNATETVSDFYDRCVLAMKKKNHRVDAALKTNANFKRAINTDLFVFFGGGLKRHIRNATICSSNPPEDIENLLKAAKRVELQTETRDKLYSIEEHQNKEAYSSDLQTKVNELSEELAALRRRGTSSSNFRGRRGGNNSSSGTMTCWTCGRSGHFARNCFSNSRGNRGYRGRTNRRNQGQRLNEFQQGEDESEEERWEEAKSQISHTEN